MLSPASRRGFTIVELLVAMSIIAVLLALGAPAMGTYLQNSKLATAASSYFSGIQLARTEAIRQNVQAQFVLTDSALTIADLANNVAPAVNGRNWVVRAASGPGNFQPAIESKSGAEGAVVPAIQVAGAASGIAFDGTIPFNGFGATVTNTSYSIDISNPGAGLCVSAGGNIRCRRITVSAGGQIGSCDPAAPAGDSRAC